MRYMLEDGGEGDRVSEGEAVKQLDVVVSDEAGAAGRGEEGLLGAASHPGVQH